MSTMVGLKEIAREAGVSLMTVSRALRQDPKVSALLRKRIEDVAERLEYRPNPLVSALMSFRRAGKPANSRLKLGFITCFSPRERWKKFRLYREFYEGAALGADRHGYALEEFWLGEDGMTAPRLEQVLQTRNVPGIIFAPLPAPEGKLQMSCRGLAAVALGFSLLEPAVHRVSNYQFRSMMLLMHELAALGYQRPGLALPKSLDDRVLHQWLGAFLVAHGNRSRLQDPLFVLPDKSWTRQKFERWLEQRRPDVVVGQQEDLLDWLRQSGRRVPEDIGFVHLDTTPGSEISGICQNGKAIGMAAADLAVAMLHRNERGIPALPRTVLIEGAWVPGQTVRKARW